MGKLEKRKPEKALDYDVAPEAKLIPFGIFEPTNDFLSNLFGTSIETTDFIVDCLELWWKENKERLGHIKELVINLDNGPHNNSHRSQFIRRATEFADKTRLLLRLVYYPPYHSKYNSIERCWGILEDHWNGTLLSSINKAIKWAETMTWKGVHPVVHLLDKVYQKGGKAEKRHNENLRREDQKIRNFTKVGCYYKTLIWVNYLLGVPLFTVTISCAL